MIIVATVSASSMPVWMLDTTLEDMVADMVADMVFPPGNCPCGVRRARRIIRWPWAVAARRRDYAYRTRLGRTYGLLAAARPSAAAVMTTIAARDELASHCGTLDVSAADTADMR